MIDESLIHFKQAICALPEVYTWYIPELFFNIKSSTFIALILITYFTIITTIILFWFKHINKTLKGSTGLYAKIFLITLMYGPGGIVLNGFYTGPFPLMFAFAIVKSNILNITINIVFCLSNFVLVTVILSITQPQKIYREIKKHINKRRKRK